MPSVYGNLAEDDAAKALAESYGLKPEVEQEPIPKLRQCPNVTCEEMNNPDAPFCAKCRVPLTVSGFMEQDIQKEQEMVRLSESHQVLLQQMESKNVELQGLKERMDMMGEIMMKLDSGLRDFRCELEYQRYPITDEKQKRLDSRYGRYREGLMSYINKFHPSPPEHRLSEQQLKRLEKMKKQIRALPPDDAYIPELDD